MRKCIIFKDIDNFIKKKTLRCNLILDTVNPTHNILLYFDLLDTPKKCIAILDAISNSSTDDYSAFISNDGFTKEELILLRSNIIYNLHPLLLSKLDEIITNFKKNQSKIENNIKLIPVNKAKQTTKTTKETKNIHDMPPFPKMPDRELPPLPEGWLLHGGFYDFQ